MSNYLAAAFPRTVLDVLVARNNSPHEGRRDIFRNFRERRPCPLGNIDDATLLAWAQENAEERFLQLAEVVRAWSRTDGKTDDDEAGSVVWTPTALRLIREAPDPIPILTTFCDGFHPSGWLGGSLAGILASRLPLLEQFTQDKNPAIAAWAKAAVISLTEEVEKTREWEAKHNRERDESFEY